MNVIIGTTENKYVLLYTSFVDFICVDMDPHDNVHHLAIDLWWVIVDMLDDCSHQNRQYLHWSSASGSLGLHQLYYYPSCQYAQVSVMTQLSMARNSGLHSKRN